MPSKPVAGDDPRRPSTSVFKPVRSRRAFEEVADRVRGMVESGELRVGDRLPPERELSRQLNVSRTVLREALRTLENAGLLELRPGKAGGAFVADARTQAVSDNLSDLLRLGNVSLAQLTEARAWIEEVVVRVACERAEESDFLALEENVHQAEALFSQDRMMDKLDANIEFHNVLARATKNPVLVMMTQTLANVMRSFGRRLGAETTRSVIRPRARFIQLMRERNAEGAVSEMNEHLRAIQQAYISTAKSKSQDGLRVATAPKLVARSITTAAARKAAADPGRKTPRKTLRPT
jgi:DNA-binding FadR family transcriptional regulator